MQRRLSLAMLAMLIVFFLSARPGFAQGGEDIKTLKKEIETLKEGQNGIQKDLDELKKLLQAGQMPPAQPEFKETDIDIVGAPMKGKKDARLVLMEFSDYQ
jgi:peptidoglycan hydrolase CwlO-like protein